jgi:hypothetical protein
MVHLPSVPALAGTSAPWSVQSLEAISVLAYEYRSEKDIDPDSNDIPYL